uniref:IF2B/IF5 domain protein n=1 Tax=Pithovirus LCDPAC01 TaxID=2506600 RepID=A0A481YMC3_9VIRU|nr:MAG: IF2B/IF5 domain protein [Pithovirus LCDPAC01]
MPLKIFSKAYIKRVNRKLGRSNMGNTPVFQGTIPIKNFEKILESFIRKHILCKVCHLPELDYSTKTCRSCGLIAETKIEIIPVFDQIKYQEQKQGVTACLRKLYVLRKNKINLEKIDKLLDYGWRCKRDDDTQFQHLKELDSEISKLSSFTTP